MNNMETLGKQLNKAVDDSTKELRKMFSVLETEEPTDVVNHPPHYESGQFECIDVMVETQGVEAVQDFCICNAFKYLYRHKMKNGVQDVEKAMWYLKKYLELEEGEEL